MARLNTSLASQGAEFLTLGNLLVSGIQAYKAYTNHPAYDLVAVNPDTNKACRISVKSRYASDFDGGFPLKNLECDFVVFVALNRGFYYGKKGSGQGDGIRAPEFFVFPTSCLKPIRKDDAWNKVYLRDVDGWRGYQDGWDLIMEFLKRG